MNVEETAKTGKTRQIRKNGNLGKIKIRKKQNGTVMPPPSTSPLLGKKKKEGETHSFTQTHTRSRTRKREKRNDETRENKREAREERKKERDETGPSLVRTERRCASPRVRI